MGVLGFTRSFNGFSIIRNKIIAYSFDYLHTRALSSFSTNFNGHDLKLPVLIVGAGPVGLVLAILLTKLVLFQVFRKLDGLAEEIQKSQPPVDSWRKFIYCTSLSGSILGSVDHFQPQDFEQIVSPVSVAHFSQYKLTRLLVKKLENLNFHILNCEGLGGSDAGRPVGEREILLGHEWVLVAHDLKDGEFILQIPFYPPQQNVEDFTHEICERIIFKLIGKELADINVIDIKPWVMHAEVAEKFVSCDERIILAGDAAHRFPPAGGFEIFLTLLSGLCAIDAHNLAWKLASVVRGTSPHSIIRTYETERRPVGVLSYTFSFSLVFPFYLKSCAFELPFLENFQIAISNTALSVQNFRAAMAVPAALGLDPTVANSGKVGSILPYGLQRGILDGLFILGRAQLSDFVLNENNPLGSSRLAKLRCIFEEGKSLQLQFPAEDLGFRYLQGAVVPSSVMDVPDAPTGRRWDYVPSADPGTRLPHMNVRASSNLSNEESYRLAHAAFKVAEEFKVSAKVCVMWPHGTAEVGSKAALSPWQNYVDVMEVKQKSTSLSWWKLCQMTDRGAILVRPDEHIAWQVKSTVLGDPVLEMRRVFSAILGVK
ncbi:FAD/NAD(P)-binding oxidoreductase family protein [Actinidia rufa]|uniref:FAD/NAD(P)-binding oxidoreductase family protein n=1 Tax=Actinidia rufa TaxID=165716 RepID=A0A7J0FMP9_9ERIC|nr:FAD/NAD(P)-binding oxidoreductase family protein [Actinidia rufa]